MQIRTRIRTGVPETQFEKELEVELLSFGKELASLLNAGIKFADNFSADIVSVADTGSANAEFTVSHDLKRIPTGYIIIGRDAGGVVYDSTTSWTVTTLYLKCTVANMSLTVLIF